MKHYVFACLLCGATLMCVAQQSNATSLHPCLYRVNGSGPLDAQCREEIQSRMDAFAEITPQYRTGHFAFSRHVFNRDRLGVDGVRFKAREGTDWTFILCMVVGSKADDSQHDRAALKSWSIVANNDSEIYFDEQAKAASSHFVNVPWPTNHMVFAQRIQNHAIRGGQEYAVAFTFHDQLPVECYLQLVLVPISSLENPQYWDFAKLFGLIKAPRESTTQPAPATTQIPQKQLSGDELFDLLGKGEMAFCRALPLSPAWKTASGRRGGPLWLEAASNQQTNALLMMLEHGADPNQRDEYGLTPIHHAINNMNDFGHADELVVMLLEHGADIDAQNETADAPIFLAISQYNYRALELLLANGADINKRNREGLTPLQLIQNMGFSGLIPLIREEEWRRHSHTSPVHLERQNTKQN